MRYFDRSYIYIYISLENNHGISIMSLGHKIGNVTILLIDLFQSLTRIWFNCLWSQMEAKFVFYGQIKI